MIQEVELYNSTLPQQQRISISVEIEKTRESLYQLFAHGDVVGVSQTSSNIKVSQSCFSMSDLLSGVFRCSSVKTWLVISASCRLKLL